MPPPAKFLPTAEALLLAAISMFCSGTGAVLALGTDLAVNEATVDLLVRIRAAVRSLFDDAAMHAKLPPSAATPFSTWRRLVATWWRPCSA